jgi:hypothetical protein
MLLPVNYEITASYVQQESGRFGSGSELDNVTAQLSPARESMLGVTMAKAHEYSIIGISSALDQLFVSTNTVCYKYRPLSNL